MSNTRRLTRGFGVGRPLDGHSLRPFLENPRTDEWSGPDEVLTALYKWARFYDPAKQSYVNEENAADLVAQCDLIVDCAPLFPERFAMNRQAVQQNKPLVECAMYEMEAHITTVVPYQSPCLQCVFPEDPPTWKRQFPVLGAVSGTVACMGAVEAVKVITGLGDPLTGRLLRMDLRRMTFQTMKISRRSDCKVCGNGS